MPDSASDTQTSTTIRVAVVDTRRLVREGLGCLLDAEPDLSVIGVAHVDDLKVEEWDVLVRGLHVGPTASGPRREVLVQDAVDVPDLVRAIRARFRTSPVRDRDRLEGDRASASERLLTVREQDVLRAVGSGGSAAQIAAALGISPRTVERHKQSVMAKLGVPNQARAVSKSIELRLLDNVR